VPSARVIAPLALLIAGTLALAGCTADTRPVATSTPTPKSSISTALTPLVPTYPKTLTETSSKKGTVAAADAIQALIASNEIVKVDDQSKFVPATKTDGAFYGVARGVATVTGFDPIAQAEAMEKLLVAAGWKARDAKTTTARYSAVLTVTTAAGVSVLGLQALAQAENTPATVLITIESPDFNGD
jgi:hypothetical protein